MILCVYCVSRYTYAISNMFFLRTQDIHMISDELYNYNPGQNFLLQEVHVIPSTHSRHLTPTLDIVDVHHIHSVARN